MSLPAISTRRGAGDVRCRHHVVVVKDESMTWILHVWTLCSRLAVVERGIGRRSAGWAMGIPTTCSTGASRGRSRDRSETMRRHLRSMTRDIAPTERPTRLMRAVVGREDGCRLVTKDALRVPDGRRIALEAHKANPRGRISEGSSVTRSSQSRVAILSSSLSLRRQ